MFPNADAAPPKAGVLLPKDVVPNADCDGANALLDVFPKAVWPNAEAEGVDVLSNAIDYA